MTAAPRHSRRGIVIPFAIVGVLLALWSVWWVVLARQVETRLEAQATAMRADGWTLNWTGSGATGWPFRTRIALDDAVITAPSGHGIAAPALVAEANAWNPDRWMVIAPDGLTLARPGKGDVAVGGKARLSVSHLRARFPDLRMQLIQPTFAARPGAEVFPIASAELVELYARPHMTNGQASTDQMDVLFRLMDARGRPGGPVEGASRQGRLTAQIEATLDQASHLSGADAAGVFSNWTRAGGRFVAVKGELSAGESRARIASQTLSAREDGRLEGRLALTAERPMEAIAGLAGSRSGAVNRMGAAGAAAAAGAQGERPVDLTLIFRDGRTWLGPFALAPAPKLF